MMEETEDQSDAKELPKSWAARLAQAGTMYCVLCRTAREGRSPSTGSVDLGGNVQNWARPET